jgi:phosphodiesterase/alkaline phosphatase D-like protein
VASKNITSTGATISWSTNEPADTQLEYGPTTSYGTLTPLDASLFQSHSVTISGLSANTPYHYRVKSKDAAGNLAVSGDFSFTTAPVDTQPPVISSVTSKNITSTGATITWSTNEPADSQVEYGLSTSYGTMTPLDTNLTQTHSVTLSGLSFNTTYHYRVRSKDAAGNLALSEDYFFTTAASAIRAQLRLVKKSYAYPGEGWDNAIDGDIRGWDGTVTADGNPSYAIFAFADNSIKSVSKVRLMTDTGVGFGSRWVTQFTVQVSTTDTYASSFTPVLNKAAKNGGAWQEYPLASTQAKYIKLILDQPSSGYRQIGEFEVYVNQ